MTFFEPLVVEVNLGKLLQSMSVGSASLLISVVGIVVLCVSAGGCYVVSSHTFQSDPF